MIRAALPALILSFALASCIRADMEPPPLPEPKPAPLFSLRDLADDTVTLDTFKGKPLVINFWATWCVPCRTEMPYFQEIYDERKGEGLEFLMVNTKESKEVVEKFIKDNGYTFRVVLDESGGMLETYQVFGLPTTYWVDADGVIQYTYMGETTIGIMKMGLKTILPSLREKKEG